jgi:hypothetical protein
MARDDKEYSPSGDQIYRHEKQRDFEPATGDEELIQAVSDHIEEYVGPVANVFHEIVSDKVHLDVHMVEPTRKRPFYTLVTSGMSERRMKVPPEAGAPKYAELCVCLPEDWRLSQKAFEKEENFWPVRWLKTIARLPHDYDTWIGLGHTVPNGDPPEPFADNTDFCCWLVVKPVMFDKGFRRMTAPSGRKVAFFNIVPLYDEEVEFKLHHGADDLLDLFDDHEIDDVIDLNRPNVAKKKLY